MNRFVMVTGAFGFLGRHVARRFFELGYHVTGIGHGTWSLSEYQMWGISEWIDADVTLSALESSIKCYRFIIHCGGSSSVAYSFSNPLNDFQKSVESTAAVLEFVRKHCISAKIIFPSTPAVQGDHDNAPIKELDPSHPVSPYGVHKKLAEELCLSYQKNFGINVSIVRFFSIYGEELRKQLLWEACNKITESSCSVQFWGTGTETRDWIHIDDALDLLVHISEIDSASIVNGGSGISLTVSDTLDLLKSALGADVSIEFNGLKKEGDPKYYWADMSVAKQLKWVPKISFETGVKRYAQWFKEQV